MKLAFEVSAIPPMSPLTVGTKHPTFLWRLESTRIPAQRELKWNELAAGSAPWDDQEKRFRAKGHQENDKTVAMAPLGFSNEYVWVCEDSRLNQGYQSLLYLSRFIFYLEIDKCQGNRKLCVNHRHHWIAYSFHVWGVPEDLVLFQKLQADNQSMQVF